MLVSRIVRDRKPLPTMVTGMVIGMLGFVCLAFATTVWIFILGIAVFSIGEMTAHPKYYSYVGLVAPADRKAVYMGYAFLYGVIGSLLGSNLGGVLYESMLKPLVGRGDVTGDIRSVLDAVCRDEPGCDCRAASLQQALQPRHAGDEREGTRHHDRHLLRCSPCPGYGSFNRPLSGARRLRTGR